MNASPPKRLEFVCSACLRSRVTTDLAKRPVCPRCGIMMEPDSDAGPHRYRRPDAKPTAVAPRHSLAAPARPPASNARPVERAAVARPMPGTNG